MPTGKPIGSSIGPIGFLNFKLDNFFGFFEETVNCPITLDPPVLLFKTMGNRMLFFNRYV